MKKLSLRLLVLCLAMMMLCAVLASCGRSVSGVYENNTLGLITTYTFSGNEFVRTMKGLSEYDAGLTVTGTFRIEGETIYLTSSTGSVEELTFSKKDGMIYIAGMEFEKQ